MKKSILTIFLVVALCLLQTGCLTDTSDKTYTSHGMSITMPDGFYEKSLASVTVYFESQETIVTALKEDFTTLAAVNLGENSTLQDYGQAVLANNQKSEELKEKDGLTYFTYTTSVSGKNFFYTAVVYKANDSFWLLNFACEDSNKDKYEDAFLKWAKTVSFS